MGVVPMIRSSAARPVLVFPELAGIVSLAAISFTPLVLSSGVELIDWLFYSASRDQSLLSLEPLVGLDAWLHWMARLLIAVGLANVVVRRVGPLLSFRRLVRDGAIGVPEPGTDLHRLAIRHDRLSSIRVLPDRHGPVAFTAGVFSPRIYVSETILEALDTRELELLLLHEIKHCRSLDPFRSLVATILGDLFFWIPAVRMLEARVMSKIEFAADDAAAALDRAGLARTILKVVSLGTPETSLGIPFARKSRLTSRIRRLMRVEDGLSHHPVTAWTVPSTVMVLIALWTLGLTAYGTHNAHQDEGPEGAWRHALVLNSTPV
jgi:Zn-dependent protease with chaperone function